MNDFLKSLSQNLIQSSLDGILAFDRDCRYTVWNPAMERISGFEKSKVLGRCAFDLFPLLKQTGEDRYFFQTLEGKSTVTEERPYVIPETGREGSFEGHYSPIFGDSGEVIGGLPVIREITERKRAAESLRETNQALQALLEASPLAIHVLDIHGKVEMWNPAAERIFGWSEKEVVGRFNPIIPKDQEEDFKERMDALLKGKASLTIEVRRLKKDGSLIDLTLSTAPLRDAQGKMQGVMGILADITERKRAEQALQIKTDQLAAITEAMTSYLKTGNWREASAQLLHAALTQTGSASGFIGVLVEGGGLRVFADEGMILDPHAGHPFLEKIQSYQEVGYLDFTDFNNLFGSVITSGKPLLTNAPSGDPRSAGLPKGHLPLNNFLGVPIRLEGEVVGMIGVANRPGGYTACQQAEIEVLSQAAGVLYDSYRRKNREATLEKKRKEAEEALRISESRFRQVVDFFLIGIVFSDINGNITEANDAFLRIIGYNREDLRKGEVSWKERTPPEYHPLDARAVDQMIATAVCVPFEKEFTRKDGSRVPVMIGAAFLEGSRENTVGFVLDLTERKRVRQELKKSEIRFQRLFESDLFGIILGEADGTVRDVNNAFLQMVGYTEEDLRAGRINWEAMTPPEYRHLDQQASVDILEKGAFIPFEKEYIRKDGSRIPILIGGAALEDPQSNQGICFILDITDRKEADERLRQSEEKYRLLFESNPYPMWVFDLETFLFLAVNQAAVRRYGYSREEFLSMTITELMPKEDVPLLMKNFPEIRTRVGYAGIWRNKKKDGTVIDVEITSDIISFAGKRAKIAVANDITERLRAEEAVKRSEAHLRAIINSEPECVKTVAIDGTLLAMNPAGLAMVQANSEAEVVGRNTFELVHPEDRPAYLARHRSAGEGEPGHLQFRVVGLQGRLRWVETYVVPLRDQQGKISSVLSVTRDITERRQAEEKLSESQRTYTTLISNLPGLAYRCRNDKEWTMEFISEGTFPLTGYPPSDFIEGRVTFGRLIHPADREPIWNIVQAALREQKPYQLVYRIRPASGNEKWMWEQGRGVFSPGGELLFLEGLITDMTERKRAEEVLRQSNERFNLVTRATNDAVWDWDLTTNALWWSENFQTLFNYKPEQIEQTVEWWVNRLHPDDRDRIFSGVLAAVGRGERFWAGEYRFLRGDGTYATIFDRGYVVYDEEGKPIRMIGALMDITERKLAQKELEKSHAQLRDLSTHLQTRLEEERTRIAREIHDEFGQVLTVLKMEISWLQKKFSGKQQQALREKAQSMSKLIDSAIQTVRKTATDLRPGILDDLGLTAAIEWQAQEFEKRTGIPCKLSILPEDMTIDPDRSTAIFRILQETLTNVARHAQAARVDIHLTRTDEALILKVKDNGIGITDHQATDSKSLGLLGIRERVRLWQGEVTISGTERLGTEVHVRLPIERGPAPGRYDQNSHRR